MPSSSFFFEIKSWQKHQSLSDANKLADSNNPAVTYAASQQCSPGALILNHLQEVETIEKSWSLITNSKFEAICCSAAAVLHPNINKEFLKQIPPPKKKSFPKTLPKKSSPKYPPKKYSKKDPTKKTPQKKIQEKSKKFLQKNPKKILPKNLETEKPFGLVFFWISTGVLFLDPWKSH